MAPANDDDITELYMGVRRKEPKYPGFAYGYLYATQSAKRRVVAVPYNYGVTKLRSIDELFVHAWVPNSTLSSSVVNMAVGRVLVSELPGSSAPLEFSYSIIYVPSASPLVSVNNDCPALRSKRRWAGNILVLKHGKRKPIINMEREDAYLVDAIVSSYIDRRLLE